MRILPALVASALSLTAGLLAAQEAEPPDPFFRENSVATATLTAPMKFVRRDRSVEEQAPGSLALGDAVFDVQVRARGQYRRQKRVCDFPPLRLNFKKSQTRDTVLHGFDKVKLVTHCETASKRYDQDVVREYLAYKILNLLTDQSFNARLLRLTYHDSDGRQANITKFAILIEHRERVAKRIGKPMLEIEGTRPSALDRKHANLIAVFQYMIGNTDFSLIAGAEGDRCCHNAELFGTETEPLVAIPYDFDMAGIVDARHATPNPRFSIDAVTDRLYRGRCTNNEYLQATLDHFIARQDAILELIATVDGPTDATRKKAARYVASFYTTILKPKSVERRMRRACI